MSTEELLRPRYKIIAPIPFKEEEDFWKVGEILDRDWGWHGDDEDGFKYHISDYPHLFKKLEWWEERAIDDMPEYLNCPSRGMFFKVEKWHKSYFIIDGRQKMQYRNYIPATLAEYEEYINQKP